MDRAVCNAGLSFKFLLEIHGRHQGVVSLVRLWFLWLAWHRRPWVWVWVSLPSVNCSLGKNFSALSFSTSWAKTCSGGAVESIQFAFILFDACQ